MRLLILVRCKISLSLNLFLLTLLSAGAQNADDYFYGGAQHFLTNNIPGALEVVTNGLQRFPDDQKLLKLHELLKQQQQQQNQDQKQQDQDQKDDKKQDQKQDQQKQDDNKDPQSKNDQQKMDEQKKEQEKNDPQQAKSGDKSKDKPEQNASEPQQVAAHAMTPQEAKQLLDAQKDDEQVLIFQPQGEAKNRTKRLKDW
jgi:outer membrane biosynthesis protein TonB